MRGCSAGVTVKIDRAGGAVLGYGNLIRSSGREKRLVSAFIGRSWLRLFGWKIHGELPDCQKFILIAAPHTSNWDLPFMLATAWALKVRVSWFGKHTIFGLPWGWLLRK